MTSFGFPFKFYEIRRNLYLSPGQGPIYQYTNQMNTLIISKDYDKNNENL